MSSQKGSFRLLPHGMDCAWLSAIEHRESDTTLLAHYDYTRNYAGKITTASQPGVHSVAYTYDNAWQLTHEVRTGTSAYDISYTYDATGNRLTKVQGGVTDSYSYGDNNQLLSTSSKSFQYDNDGNLTSVTTGGQTTSLTWDYNDRCTGITYPGGATNSFVTNDLGKRVSKTDSSGTTTYLFDGGGVLADSRADYTQGGFSGLISERAGSASKFYHGDQMGSTRGITDSSQAVSDSREYDSFGLTIASTGSTATPFKFAGGEGYQADADSGLMLLGARYFDPSVGRFISRDPIGYEGGLNLYVYCGNSPVGRVDPSGLGPIGPGFGPTPNGYDPTKDPIIRGAIRAMGTFFRRVYEGARDQADQAILLGIIDAVTNVPKGYFQKALADALGTQSFDVEGRQFDGRFVYQERGRNLEVWYEAKSVLCSLDEWCGTGQH